MVNPTATKNALCSSFATLVDAATGGGKVKILTSGDVLLATFTLSTTGFGSPSSGVITAASMPKATTAVATGTPAKYTITDGDDTLVGNGTAAVGSSECNLDGTITNGQACSLSSFTYTQPTGS